MKMHAPVGTRVVSVLASVVRVFGGLAALAVLVVFTPSDGIRNPFVSLIHVASADQEEEEEEEEAIESIITEEDDNIYKDAGSQAEGTEDAAAPMTPPDESDIALEPIVIEDILTEDDDVEPAVESDPPGDDEDD